MDKIKYYNTEKSILSEFYRLEQLQIILFKIRNIYAKIHHKFINNYKKKKISTFISLWIMNQYNNIDIKEIIPDPFFPYNGTNNKQLENNLINSNLVKNIQEAQLLLSKWDLTTQMTNACVAVTKFLTSIEYKTNFNNYKAQIFEEQNSNIKINISCNGNNDNDNNNDNNNDNDSKILFKFSKPMILYIPKQLFDKLIKKYSISISSRDECIQIITILLLRYYILDSDNQQLAVIPEFYNILESKYSIDIELFASGINFYFENYASIYYDIEHTIGSIGFFLNYQNIINNDILEKTNIKKSYTIVANPPFDEDIMLSMTNKFIEWLNSDNPISIILTIPQWGEFSTFETYEILKSSGFIKYYTIIPKSKARFYNYMKNKYIYPCNIYLIVLQNNMGNIKYPHLCNDLDNIKNIIYG